MRNRRAEIPQIWITDYHQHLQQIMLGRLRVVFLLVIIITILDGSFQLLLQQALFYGLIWIRALTISMCMLLFASTFISIAQRNVFTVSIIGILTVIIDIEAAIIESGGYHSSFQTGLALLIVAIGILFPFSVAQMGIVCSLVWVVFLGPVIIGAQPVTLDNTGFFINIFFLICSSIITLVASQMTSRLREQEFFSGLALKEEQDKSERLLLNILPQSIADRLKNSDETISDSFEDATVLFADIVGFTPFSERLRPTDLVEILNEMFSRFDELTEKYGLEKIKTIGDAYMVAGGMPLPDENHAQAVANMALDMVDEMARFSRQIEKPLDIRIGICSGPVVAGVIGQKKFIYDLWGDTVNTASRMESHGSPGRIQTTESTFRHLQDKYEFEERGIIHVKGKGEMKTYFLKKRKSGPV